MKKTNKMGEYEKMNGKDKREVLRQIKEECLIEELNTLRDRVVYEAQKMGERCITPPEIMIKREIEAIDLVIELIRRYWSEVVECK